MMHSVLTRRLWYPLAFVGCVLMLTNGVSAPAQAAPLVTAVIPHDAVSGIGTLPQGVAVASASGRAYVANTADGTVSVVDTRSLSVVAVVRVGDGPEAVAVDDRGGQVYVANNNANGTISVIDIATNTVKKVIPHDSTAGIGRSPQGIAVDSGGRRAYVTNYGDKSVSVIDTASNTVIDVIEHGPRGIGAGPWGVAVDEKTKQAYVANSNDGTVSVIDTLTNSVTKVIPHDPVTGIGLGPVAVAVDQDLHRAYVVNSTGSSVSIIDTSTNAVTKVMPAGPTGSGRANDVEIDPIAHQAFVANEATGDVSVFNTLTDSLTRVVAHDPVSGIGNSPYSVGFDAGTQRAFVVNSRDGTVSVIDARATAPIARIGGADRFAVSAAVSEATFDTGVLVAYVASGAVFPDALSGSAAAGVEGGPLLLVSREAIPSPVSEELSRLKPGRIVVLGGTTTIGSSVEESLRAFAPVVERLAGADRYEVAATISAGVFTPGVAVAYVASGAVFPDALSASAAAGAKGGPVLLVTKDAVPPSVRAELARLKPAKLVVVGGTDTIAESTVAALRDFAPTVRLAGVDRFSVSAAISANAYPIGSDTVFVASGAVFPDALSGAAAAVAQAAPMLLVLPDSVPAAAAAELDRLSPTRIVVLGGPNTISAGVLEELRRHVR